jgi:hypothetical protein
MSDCYIIEVNSQPAGVVVRNAEGFRFFAASQRFDRMEGKLYRNAGEAERAARRLDKTRLAAPVVVDSDRSRASSSSR